jgi:hypothetical protein
MSNRIGQFIGYTFIAVGILGILMEIFSISLINIGCFGGYYTIKTMLYCFWALLILIGFWLRRR